MQDLQVIDHLRFRKLFGESFASFNIAGYHGQGGDDYVIETSGVRWKHTEDDFLQEVGHFLGPSDDTTITMLETIQRAKLAFPCSPAQALEWAINNRDTGAAGDGPNGFIYVPDWLIEALGQDDVSAALGGLSVVAERLAAEIAEAQADGNFEKQRDASKEQRGLALAIEAFEEIQCCFPIPAKVSGAQGGAIANEHNNAVKKAIQADYLSGQFTSKNAAAFELGKRHNRSPETVRKILRNL